MFHQFILPTYNSTIALTEKLKLAEVDMSKIILFF